MHLPLCVHLLCRIGSKRASGASGVMTSEARHLLLSLDCGKADASADCVPVVITLQNFQWDASSALYCTKSRWTLVNPAFRSLRLNV